MRPVVAVFLLVLVLVGCSSSGGARERCRWAFTPPLEELLPTELPDGRSVAVLPYVVPSSKDRRAANFSVQNASGGGEATRASCTSTLKALYKKIKYAHLQRLLAHGRVREVEIADAVALQTIQLQEYYNSDTTPKLGHFEGYDAVFLLYFDGALIDCDGGSAPPALWAICRRALAKEPGRRYADGEALAADLDAFLAGGPVAAAGRRRRAALSLGCAGALAGGLALAFTLAGRPAEDAPAPDAPAAERTRAAETPAPPERTPGAAWREVEAIEGRLERYLAARAWLARFSPQQGGTEPGARRLAADARALLAVLAGRPLAHLPVADGSGRQEVHVAFAAGRIVAAPRLGGALSCFAGTRLCWRAAPFCGAKGRGAGALLWDPAGSLTMCAGLERAPTAETAPHLALGTGWLRHVALAPGGRLAAVAPQAAEVLLVDLEARASRRLALPERVNGLAFTPDGARLALCTGDLPPASSLPRGSEVSLWDAATGEPLARAAITASLPLSVTVVPGGSAGSGRSAGERKERIALGTGLGEVHLFDDRLAFQERLPPVTCTDTDAHYAGAALPGPIYALAAPPGGGLIAASSAPEGDPEGQRWLALFAPDGACRFRARLEHDIIDLAIDPVEGLLFLGTAAGTVEIWALPE